MSSASASAPTSSSSSSSAQAVAASLLPSKSGSKKMDKKPSTPQVKKARKQVTKRKNLQREEGAGEYNIWYHKYLGQKRERWEDKEPADTRVDIERDSGWTMGESHRDNHTFCLHFAHGCCDKGHECRYLHRLPTMEDKDKIPFNRDVFGRQKFGTDRDDMGGIGSFNRECKTLFLAGFKTTDPKLEELVTKNFKEFGEMEYVRVFADRGFGFVKYKSRLNAEFAREAMHRQSLGNDEVLCVKWASDDPNPLAKDLTMQDRRMQVVEAVKKRGISTVDLPYDYPSDFTPQLGGSGGRGDAISTTTTPASSSAVTDGQYPSTAPTEQQPQQQPQQQYGSYDYYAYFQQLAAQQYMQQYPPQDQAAMIQQQQQQQQQQESTKQPQMTPETFNYHAYYHRLKQQLQQQQKSLQQSAEAPVQVHEEVLEEAPIEEPAIEEPIAKRARIETETKRS